MIRWGIWGTGAVAGQVASDFHLVKGAVLRAIASRTIERSRFFAVKYGAGVCYEGLEPLLNDAEIDAVYVASPNYRHLDDSLACIGAGKALLCEKPFALNLAQARQIAEAARHRKIFCMEAMWTRFIPAVMEARRCIGAGAIGAVRVIQGNFAYPVAAGLDSRFFEPALGGGALLDRGVYLISLAQQLLGAPESMVGTASVGPTGVDEQSAYQLAYASGALAVLAASLRARGSNEVTIFGERGLLRLCEPFYCAHRLVVHSYRHPVAAHTDLLSKPRGAGKAIGVVRDSPTTKLLRRRLSPLLAFLRRGRVRNFPFAGNGYQFELQHVTECLNEQRCESAIMPLEDSLEVMQTMDALRSQMGLAGAISAKSRRMADDVNSAGSPELQEFDLD